MVTPMHVFHTRCVQPPTCALLQSLYDMTALTQGNEEWINSLVQKGDLTEFQAWQPWYNDVWTDMPAGYVTTYNVTGAPTKDFSFLTIRLAGHMVPTFQPISSLSFISRFLAHRPLISGAA